MRRLLIVLALALALTGCDDPATPGTSGTRKPAAMCDGPNGKHSVGALVTVGRITYECHSDGMFRAR